MENFKLFNNFVHWELEHLQSGGDSQYFFTQSKFLVKIVVHLVILLESFGISPTAGGGGLGRLRSSPLSPSP